MTKAGSRSTAKSGSRKGKDPGQKEPGRTAVVVLGMHRSGTSALTRTLNLLGVDLGRNLMQAVADNNEAGFWEHQGVVDAHDRLLRTLGMRWDDPRAMPAGWLASEAADQARDELAAILDGEFAQATLWGIKDPRMCRLFPLWRPLLEERGIRPTIVHMVRHPLEIARSLDRRDNLPRGRSLLLWLRHQIEAIQSTEGLDQVWCTFDDLMADWRHAMQSVDGTLGLGLTLDDKKAAKEIDGSIQPKLRHHMLDATALSDNEDLAAWVGTLHSATVDAGSGRTKALAESADSVGREIDRAGFYLDDTFRSFEATEIALREEIDLRDDMIRLRDEQLHERTGQVVERDARLAERDAWVAERDARVAERNDRITERDGWVAERDARISERDGHIATLSGTVETLRTDFQRTAQHYEELTAGLRGQIDAIHGSTSWRWSRPIRTIGARLGSVKRMLGRLRGSVARSGGVTAFAREILRLLRAEGVGGVLRRGASWRHSAPVVPGVAAPEASEEQAYARYIEVMEPTPTDLLEMARSVATMKSHPVFSIVVPVYDVDEEWLRAFVGSVRAQVYPHWELCLADDCSTKQWIRPALDEFAASDERIKVTFRKENGRISAATNTALELATGEFICLMDNDDEIAPNALYEFARLLNENPSLDMIYSDEDKLSLDGERYEPFFKPDWSPEALEGCMYTAHFACYRTKLVRKIKGFRSECDGAQDYDFVLRFTELTDRIAHIPKVLYHWRAIPGSTAKSMEAKDYVLDSALRALTERAERMYGGGTATLGKYHGSFEVRCAVKGKPLVSVVIPSAGRDATIRGKTVDLLPNVVRSIHEKNTYKKFEIIIVDNGDLRAETKKALEPYDCRFVTFTGEFNVAEKMNMGAAIAKGKHLLFMNDDIEVLAEDWMECMLQLSQRKGVGAVGGKLFFENGTLQHVGVGFCRGLPDHINRELPGESPGHFFSNVANRNYTAVTGAVLMMKRAVFEDVGGFDERFRINYNDVDLCAKVREAGLRVVFAAGAELHHFESISRARTVAADEIALFLEKWGKYAEYDPYYSSNFASQPPVFQLRHDWVKPSETERR